MALISLGVIDKNFISIFIGCIFCFLSRLSFTYEGTTLFNHEIICNIVAEGSKFFALAPFLIIRKREKETDVKDNTDNDNKINNTYSTSNINKKRVEYLYTDFKLIMKKRKLSLIIFSSILFFIQSILMIYTMPIKTNTWILDILLCLLFYYLIFKIRLYKHHFISIILIIIIGFIPDIIFGNLQNDLSNNIFLFFIRLIREIIYSLYDVINKYIMEKKTCSVYELALINGIMEIILLGLFSLFNLYIYQIDNFDEYFDSFTNMEILIIFATIITQLGLYLCNLFTIKNLTPCHFFIVYVVGRFAYYIDFSKESIIVLIFYLLILFLSLIFNEIIEIKFCGLEKNTKKNIRYRSEIEDLLTENYFSEVKNLGIDEISENECEQIELQSEVSSVCSE